MSIRPILAGLTPLLILAACASNPPANDKQQVAEQKVECERSYTTGSMLPKKDCAPPMTEEERRRVQDDLANRVRQNAPRPPGQ